MITDKRLKEIEKEAEALASLGFLNAAKKHDTEKILNLYTITSKDFKINIVSMLEDAFWAGVSAYQEKILNDIRTKTGIFKEKEIL